MAGTEVPEGWYPDPSGTGWRWWDGARWTALVREAPPATGRGRAADLRAVSGHVQAWVRERAIAVTLIGGLIVLSLAMVIAAIVATGDPSTDEFAIADADAGAGSDGSASSDDAAGQESGSEAADGDDDTAADDSDSTDRPTGEGGPGTVDFDGVCEVEIDPAELEDREALRPWQFPACERAPIDPSGSGGRWIVVVASLDGGGFDEAEALDRAEGFGLDGKVLWSSHYPSLNPDLWVVFDGPFPSEADATAASERLGGGSYPRLLSDDPGDRYCIAADGCVGERAD